MAVPKQLPQGTHPVGLIADRLEVLIKVGARPARLGPFGDLLDLILERGTVDDEGDVLVAAHALVERLKDAISLLGDGPAGRAAQELFGLTTDTRGLPLKDRRRVAAESVGVMPSTFRKYYERDILEDVAFELWCRGREDSERKAQQLTPESE